ncbi:MAG: YfhO family protein [Elusimicrobia bacterium]|nr:YfhO family protein [Elusimicrobiota bacterium]
MSAGRGADRRALLSRGAAALAGAAVLVLAWRRLLVEGLVPVDGNVLCVTFPNWRLARELWLSGSLPLWNPLRNMGTPYLADPITSALYPVQWLLSVLPDFPGFMRSWVVVHTLVAGFFWAALAKRWWGSDERGFFEPCVVTAAVVGTLNAFFMVRVVFPHNLAASAWLPAVLYFQETGSVPGMAGAFAMQWLAGYPSFSVLTALMSFVLALFQGRSGLRLWARAGAAALGLAAVQLVPFVEFLARSSRGVMLDPSFAAQFSIPPGQLLKCLLMPQWYLWRPAMTGDPAMVCFYVGAAGLALAIVGAWRGHWRERLLAGLTAACLGISLGSHLPGYEHLAFLHFFRFPNNWLLLAAAGLTLLASAGVAAIRDRRWAWASTALVAADLLVFAQAPKSAWGRPEFLTDVPSLALKAMSLPQGTRVLHTEALLERWSLSILETEEDYLLMKEFLAPSYGMAFGLSEVSNYQTMRLALAQRFRLRLAEPGAPRELLDWAGVGLVIGVEEGTGKPERARMRVSENPGARARAFLAQAQAGKAELLAYRPGRASVAVEASDPATLVFAETDHPGWRASIDGKQAPLARWQGVFMSAQVPAGRHEVVFSYEPASFRIGLALSATALVILAASVFFKKRA